MKRDGKPRKLMIVLEDDGGENFKMYMEGDLSNLELPAEQLSAAEFWGKNLFQICGAHLAQSGAVKTMNRQERRRQ